MMVFAIRRVNVSFQLTRAFRLIGDFIVKSGNCCESSVVNIFK